MCIRDSFPTGGIIIGNSGIQSSYNTGRGSIIIRGNTEIETNAKEKSSIIINEIPYQVNKSRLVEQIADCVRAKKIEGITDLRDESDKDGVRIVVELKRCLLYTSPSPRDRTRSRMPSSA